MDASLPDPSDWTPTILAPLVPLDSLLRCQICKDFYTSAVLTNCAHTFCSLCIRRCLAAEGRCPSCRAAEQESRLRKNVALQEVVDTFVGSREGLLKSAREARQTDATKDEDASMAGEHSTRGAKRKRDNNEQIVEPPAQRTRSQRNAARNSRPSSAVEGQLDGGHDHSATMNGNSVANAVIVDSDDQDAEYTPTPPGSAGPARAMPSEDGLVSCPICGNRMKHELVYSHLDTCTGSSNAASTTSKAKPAPTPKQASSPPERLPQLSYSLLKDNALRKKLSDLRIPTWGARGLLIRRHSEWLALWNANCDAKFPRSKAELLRELDAWEKSQGGRSSDGGLGSGAESGVKSKEFESEAWGQKHGDDFRDLVRRAKQGRRKTGNGQAPIDDANSETADTLAPDTAQPPENRHLEANYEDDEGFKTKGALLSAPDVAAKSEETPAEHSEPFSTDDPSVPPQPDMKHEDDNDDPLESELKHKDPPDRTEVSTPDYIPSAELHGKPPDPGQMGVSTPDYILSTELHT